MKRRFLSFMQGVGSLLELAPTTITKRPRPCPDPEEMAWMAWLEVGNALRQAMGEVELELGQDHERTGYPKGSSPSIARSNPQSSGYRATIRA